MTKKLVPIIIVAVIVFFLFSALDADAQCSMCRKIASDGNSSANKVGNNLNFAILYLMALPYVAIAFFFRKQIKSFINQFRSK